MKLEVEQQCQHKPEQTHEPEREHRQRSVKTLAGWNTAALPATSAQRCRTQRVVKEMSLDISKCRVPRQGVVHSRCSISNSRLTSIVGYCPLLLTTINRYNPYETLTINGYWLLLIIIVKLQ